MFSSRLHLVPVCMFQFNVDISVFVWAIKSINQNCIRISVICYRKHVFHLKKKKLRTPQAFRTNDSSLSNLHNSSCTLHSAHSNMIAFNLYSFEFKTFGYHKAIYGTISLMLTHWIPFQDDFEWLECSPKILEISPKNKTIYKWSSSMFNHILDVIASKGLNQNTPDRIKILSIYHYWCCKSNSDSSK